MHPLALGTARTFLGHATNIQLHLTQAIAIGPGETPQPIHRDQWAFDFFPFPAGYEVQCNTIWALTDFTEENGATRVVVGSNRREDRLAVRPRRHRAGRDGPRLGALLLGERLPRRRGQPLRRHPHRAEHHLQRGLAAPGGEPVPLGAPGGGRDAADRPAPADGLRPRGLCARLHRRPARSDRGGAARHRHRRGSAPTRRPVGHPTCTPCAISRFTRWAPLPWCRAGRDPRSGGRRLRRAVHGVQPHRRRRRGVPPAATADPGGLRRLLGPATRRPCPWPASAAT